ncbi:DUF3810 domain-containing protein [Candidatus Woesearchaeota archaeon]|nr:DUF3810 domain-containing protein [Candidatus Woesearchaeota archaeon]
MKTKTRRIPNLITYVPVSISDLIIGGLIIFYGSRLLNLGIDVLPKDVLPYANHVINWYMPHYSNMLVCTTFGADMISGITDYLARPRISQKKDVSEKLGVTRKPVDKETRIKKIDDICLEISDGYTEKKYSLKEEAKIANNSLEEIVYKIEGIRLKTSDKIKNSYLMKYLMPHALGRCDVISSDITMFQKIPYISFSILAHELAHRKRYFKENNAEVLAHLAGFATRDPVFIQSSKVSRLRRECQTLFEKYGKTTKEERKQLNEEYQDFLNDLSLPYNIKNAILKSEFQKNNILTEGIKKGQTALYTLMMKVFGQKEGPLRYTKVFTEDLYALEEKYHSSEALANALILLDREAV